MTGGPSTASVRLLAGTAVGLGVVAPGGASGLVPIDSAFGRLQSEELRFLSDAGDVELARSFVRRHIVRGTVTEEELFDLERIETDGHRAHRIEVSNGSLRIGGARTLVEDRLATNGIIHVVSEVLDGEPSNGVSLAP